MKLYFVFVILFFVEEIVFSQERPTVKIESVSSLKGNDIPEAYRFMVTDFIQSGGMGRTFVVRSEAKEVAGFYFAVDHFPASAKSDGVSLFTRDQKVLDALKSLQKDGVPLFLQSIDQKVDAQVFGDDELGNSLRGAAFPNSKKTFLLSVSPSMTKDIFDHELAHINHRSSMHPLNQFLDSIKPRLSESQFKKIRRALTELFAYQAQYQTLAEQKKKGTTNVLVLTTTPPPHRVKASNFNDIYKSRIQEIKASSGMYLQSMSSELRNMSPDTQCAVIGQARDAIKNLESIEADLVENYPEFQRCSTVTTTPEETSSGVR